LKLYTSILTSLVATLAFLFVSVSPALAAGPNPPTVFEAVTTREARPTFIWDKVSGATWYQLYICRADASGACITSSNSFQKFNPSTESWEGQANISLWYPAGLGPGGPGDGICYEEGSTKCKVDGYYDLIDNTRQFRLIKPGNYKYWVRSYDPTFPVGEETGLWSTTQSWSQAGTPIVTEIETQYLSNGQYSFQWGSSIDATWYQVLIGSVNAQGTWQGTAYNEWWEAGNNPNLPFSSPPETLECYNGLPWPNTCHLWTDMDPAIANLPVLPHGHNYHLYIRAYSPLDTGTPVENLPWSDPVEITGRLRVIELRYLPPGTAATASSVDQLSGEVQSSLLEATKDIRGDGRSAIKPQVVDVINRYTPRPSGDTWGDVYTSMLAQEGLCQRIANEDIDQIWLWVDPTIDTGHGVEYAISSPNFLWGVNYATVANFCEGESFVIMGFDVTRNYDLAMHSFGHYLEGLLGNLQTIELFWYRFAGNTGEGYPIAQRCGNVHFPPNSDEVNHYQYGLTNFVNNSCQDWNPEASGQQVSINCTAWGCDQGGFLEWWMQAMPHKSNTLTYQGKQMPNWWDFVDDMEENMQYYWDNRSTYFINESFFAQNGYN
jgi:hypothetical protein